MKALHLSFFLIFILILTGCSRTATITDDFNFPKGTSITFSTDMSTIYAWRGLHFTLQDVYEANSSTDLSSFLEITLEDDNGTLYKPGSIIGNNRHIYANCANIPRFTNLEKLQIVTKKEISGVNIRWVTGTGIN